jgi:pimeloyl-ACP methyl ester carboxylesterase
MLDATVREALLDTSAVIDQVILGRLAAKDAKLLLAGVSRGGFLSLLVAAQRPRQVKAVVSFAGGWLSVGDQYEASQNQQRLSSQLERFAAAGRESKAPSLWTYATRDLLYGERTTREFFRAYQEAGGRGEHVFVEKHDLPNGHLIAATLPLWEAAVDRFLKRLDPEDPA